MDIDEIKRIADELDKAISKDNARVSLQKYGTDIEEAFIVATERGYLRLGVEFLKAAFAPHVPPDKSLNLRPHAIEVELDYLITEDSDIQFDYFERREDLKVESHEETRLDRAIPFIILTVMLFVLALAVIGLIAIIRSL